MNLIQRLEYMARDPKHEKCAKAAIKEILWLRSQLADQIANTNSEYTDFKWMIVDNQETTGYVCVVAENLMEYQDDITICMVDAFLPSARELAAHICDLQNEWLEQKWDDKAYQHALDKDD